MIVARKIDMSDLRCGQLTVREALNKFAHYRSADATFRVDRRGAHYLMLGGGETGGIGSPKYWCRGYATTPEWPPPGFNGTLDRGPCVRVALLIFSIEAIRFTDGGFAGLPINKPSFLTEHCCGLQPGVNEGLLLGKCRCRSNDGFVSDSCPFLPK